MADPFEAQAHANRINEMVDNFLEEIGKLVDTMVAENSEAIYTKHELFLLYVNSVSTNLTKKASAKVQTAVAQRIVAQ